MSDPIKQAKDMKAAAESRFESIRRAGYNSDVTRALLAQSWVVWTEKLAPARASQRSAELERAEQALVAIYGADDLRGDSDAASHAASYRDAVDRADRTSGQADAQRLIGLASRSGDRLLARATAAHAHRRGWTEITDLYAETNPQWAAAVENAADTRISSGVGVNVLFSIRKPPELSAWGDSQIRDLVKRSEHDNVYARAGGAD